MLTEITNNVSVIRELEPWRNIGIDVENIRDTNTNHIRTGIIKAGKLKSLRDSLDGITDLYALHEINTVGEAVYVMLTYMKEFDDLISDALTIAGFERKESKGYSGRIPDIIEKYIQKDEKDDALLAHIGRELTDHAHYLPKLKVMYDNVYNQYERDRVKRNFGGTDSVSMFEGFVDEEEFDKLKEALESRFKSAQVEKGVIHEGEKVPTKLKNSGVTKSFEIVLDMYGMPTVKSFDPTAYLMPFFAIFFGLCLTDGGYGVILAVLSIYLIKRHKLVFGDSKLMWVLLISGLTTIAVGAITGGWFGDIIDYLPASFEGVKNFKNSMILFDPMQESMVFFMISLVLGFIHILFGLSMSFVKYVRDGHLYEGMCTKMTWIVFLLSVCLWILAQNGVAPLSLAAPAKYVFLTSCLAIVFLSETQAKSMGVRLAGGFYNLYGASSYVGDILSYLRLLALGLSSGVIAVVINVICKLALGIPYVGVIVAVLLFVGGHIFNVAISALGGFVHTLRLNYVEFFPKFFEGGGRLFTPFKMESNYMIFNDEADAQE